MKLIPLEEVNKYVNFSNGNCNVRGIISIEAIDPIAIIDEMIEELYEKKNCETCRQHASKLCVEHQEVESFLEKLKSLLCNYK